MKILLFNPKTLKQININNYVISVSLLTIIAFISLAFTRIEKVVNVNKYEEKTIIIQPKDTFTLEKAVKHLLAVRIMYPDIVLAQCMVESSFNSKIWKENNNCLGMRMPYKRPTFAVGEKNNHAQYRHWRDCFNDYAIWQLYCCKNLSREEYFLYLEQNYAEATSYLIAINRALPMCKQLIEKYKE